MNKGSIKQSVGQVKWSDEVALHKETDWQKLYLMAKKCNVNARVRFFQNQVLQRGLLTNRKLYLFNLIESENCDKCNMTETVTHLLVDCQHLRELWTGIERWLNRNINEHILFEKKAILLGSPENSIIVNYIFLIVKHEIYKSKWTKTKVTLIKILGKLNMYMNMLIPFHLAKKKL